MKDIKTVKCSKCGFSNILGSKKCVKCNTKLETNKKSCPKCAKINDISSVRCISCGYKFKGKKRGMLANLVISLVIVSVLIILTVLEHSGIVSNITKGLKALSLLFIVYIVYSSLSYGSKDIANYDAEKEMIKDNKKITKMKRFSNIAVVFGGLVVLGIVIYYYFFK